MNSQLTFITRIIDMLEQEVRAYQVPVVDLIGVQTQDPFKVLTATILSARTKDETTALAAERLFEQAPDMGNLQRLTVAQIEKLIYPVGFYKNKARFLQQLPQVLQEKFANRIPETVEELIQLPGVGRKTANLVVSVAFKKPAICVDTHVHRIMNILGFITTKNPLETEMILRDKLPQTYWTLVNRVFVPFGQGTCRPVSPHCDTCLLTDLCPKINVKPRKTRKLSK